MILSVIIPSYKDPLLHKTIDSLIENSELGDQLEIIAVLDGYWPEEYVKIHPRVKVVHKGKNEGMREAINTGVLVSTGEFIMRTDEHCIFCPGYDKILTKDIEENWIVTPRRFFLDPEKWEIMDLPPVDYEKLVMHESRLKFTGRKWPSRAKERKDIMIDETMMMQGSCWIMRRAWWDKVIQRLQTEGYGPLYQDQTEMVFKTWKAGGKLMVNKNAWFAHKHRSFNRTHNFGGDIAEAGWKYSLDQWKDYYDKEVLPKWKI